MEVHLQGGITISNECWEACKTNAWKSTGSACMMRIMHTLSSAKDDAQHTHYMPPLPSWLADRMTSKLIS